MIDFIFSFLYKLLPKKLQWHFVKQLDENNKKVAREDLMKSAVEQSGSKSSFLRQFAGNKDYYKLRYKNERAVRRKLAKVIDSTIATEGRGPKYTQPKKKRKK